MNSSTVGKLLKQLAVVIAVAGMIPFALDLSHAAILKFEQVTYGGMLSYDGAGGTLTGTDIFFDEIFSTGTPLNPGIPLECFGCVLNFETGANTAEGAVDGDDWAFSSGGTFTITGQALDASGSAIADGNLLEGSFTKVRVPIYSLRTGLLLFLLGFGSDIKHPGLLDFYGIQTNNFTFGHTQILSENGKVNRRTGSFSARVTTSDFINIHADVISIREVPEPSLLLLLGTVLLGLRAFTRRQSRSVPCP